MAVHLLSKEKKVNENFSFAADAFKTCRLFEVNRLNQDIAGLKGAKDPNPSGHRGQV